MTLPAWLRPAADLIVPADAVSAARRVRNTAVWGAIAAWLLPAHHLLGTETTTRRAWICGAFVVVAALAHFARRGKWGDPAFRASVLVAAAVVHVCGGVWGWGFLAFAAIVIGATAARRRFVAFESGGTEPDPFPPLGGFAPRVLAAYAWLGLSVLFMKEWAAQTMIVPTGSMQPTIMGGKDRTSSGDLLLVENFPFLFRDPKRWEIGVFQFPLQRERYFVKRVVGLPGEHVEIKDGDLWVDGKIAKKPPLVQATLWRELFPRKDGLGAPKKIVDGFRASGPWRPTSESEVVASPAAGEKTFAQFTARELRPDLRVSFTWTGGDKASALARITSRGVVASLETGTYGTTLSVGDQRQFVPPPTLAGAVWRVELCVADGQAWAVVDGHETERLVVPTDARGKNSVEIGAENRPVTFRDLRVDQDIDYVSSGTVGKWDVPKDAFFFVGDNQTTVGGRPASYDGRLWSLDVFHPPGGAAEIRAPESLMTETGGEGPANVRVADGMFRFVDVDGVPRELPVSGTTHESGVPAPFVPRSHLVGRAVMILFPFFTGDAGFRPRLLP